MDQFAIKIHHRFTQGQLQGLFTVDGYGYDDSVKVKCMPSSYPHALTTIDTIYKVFSQTYINAKEEGTMNHLVCDFLQDENGHFHFLKIHDFGADGKPIFKHDWRTSQKFTDRKLQEDEKTMAG